MAKKKGADLFGDDLVAKPQSEFERLLNSSGVSVRGLAAGDVFSGEILAVTGNEAFISTGTPTDATMPFILSAGAEKPKVGDVVQVMVVRAREGEILVKPVGSRGGSVEMDSLEDAFDMEIPVEGTVLEAVKGGFRVKVGDQKAFCPISQMDWRVVTPEDYVGKKFNFIITKFERGRDIVVSRRKVMELDRAASEGDFLATAKEGDIFSGKVFRIEKYGAFVRLDNGVDGLIPIGEMSWSRINHPQEVLNLDQVVQVKLMRVAEDGDRLKLSFSLKQGGSMDDPWATIEARFPVGSQVEGVVEGKEPFGLFVNIAGGITGLLPRSTWRDALDASAWENKRRGDRVKVRVDRIDLDAHKLSFTPPRDEEDDSWRSHTAVSGSKSSGFGSMADLFKGIKGK
jgi:small subunit ribosomal protein S1